MGKPMFDERPLKELSDDQLLDWIAYYIGFSEWVKESGSFDTGVSRTVFQPMSFPRRVALSAKWS